jgi:phage repressor protein C with HTH and peptisase S24 domain
MSPTLWPGQLVVGVTFFRSLTPGNIVIVEHEGLEKIKRIKSIQESKLFVEGDNKDFSTDSRHFGLINRTQVLAKVLTTPVFGKLIKQSGSHKKGSGVKS